MPSASIPATVAAIDARKLAGIDPAGWYSADAVGRLFGRSARTVRLWCRAGKLSYKPDPFDRRRPLVLGADILAAAGGLLLAAAPAEVETLGDRQRRAEGNLAAILALKGRAG